MSKPTRPLLIAKTFIDDLLMIHPDRVRAQHVELKHQKNSVKFVAELDNAVSISMGM